MIKFCVSITSLPSRIDNIEETINSINNQTLKPEKISEPKTETKSQVTTQPEEISEKAKKEYKKERVAKQIAKEKSQELKKEVEEETKKQLEQPEPMTIDQLLLRTEGTPTIEIDVYPNQ